MPNSKHKGNQGEKEMLQLLHSNGIQAFRNEQMYIGGFENPDISAQIAGQRVHVQVKRRESLSIYKAMEQAERDSNGIALPMVAYRRNRSKWLAILGVEDLLWLVKKASETKPIQNRDEG